jgi:hypothetical protein
LAFGARYAKIMLMDPESKQLLANTLAIAEENNKLLHKIRGVQKRATLWQVVKLLVIVGIALGSFYYIEPYLNKVMGVYNSVVGMEQKMNDSPIKDFFNKF